MNKHNDMEVMKKNAKAWLRRGFDNTREWDEIEIYLEGIEDGVFSTWESAGNHSMATYNAHSVFSELETYFEDLLSGVED